MELTPNEFRAILGDFWNRLWNDHGLVDGVVTANSAAAAQTATEADNMPGLLGRVSIEGLRRRPWKLLRIREKDVDVEKVEIGSTTIGDFRIGESKWPSAWRLTDAPEGLENVVAIVDDPAKPSIWLGKGQDFDITEGDIVMWSNPFELFDSKLEGDDRVANAWLVWPEISQGDMADYFGELLGLTIGDTAGWKRKLNAIWDCACLGCTVETVNAFLAAMAWDEVAPADGKVDGVWSEGGRWFVSIEGGEVASSDNNPIVREGDVVHKGELIFDGVTVSTLDPVPADIAGLVLPTDAGNLLFPNMDVEVEAMDI